MSNQENAAIDQDHLVIRLPDGKITRRPFAEDQPVELGIGRELDNDIVLADARVSRHHAKIKRLPNGGVQIVDLDSANGTIIGAVKATAGEWKNVAPGQTVIIGDSRLLWEQALTSQDTIGMQPVKPPAAQAKKNSGIPAYVVALVAVLAMLVLGGAIWAFTSLRSGNDASQQADVPDISQQRPEGVAGREKATPTAPEEDYRLPAIPSMFVEEVNFLPVISGALFDTEHVYVIASVRVENLGDEPFEVSTRHFSGEILRDSLTTKVSEFGQSLDKSEFSRLGVRDRFDNLTLRSGGGVSQELIFYLEAQPIDDFNLIYSPPNFNPITVNSGPVAVDQQLADLLSSGSTAGEMSDADMEMAVLPTPTLPAEAGGFARTIADSTLVGTIAFADFNGATYDLYFGNVASGEVTMWRGEASQPIFDHQSNRIAYHSWAANSRGLISSNPDHSDGYLVSAFVEDQLPSWTADNSEIFFLSRRESTRQSQLFRADALAERPDAQFVLEGEYPTWHSNNTVVFKGWGTSGTGLQVAEGADFANLRQLTDFEGDTAPSISPDGSKVVFMSNRDNNWDLYVINIDGSGLTQLTVDDAQDGLPTWSPDGNAIAFVSNRGGTWAVWAMTPTGSGIETLFTFQGSPDGFVASEPTNDSTRGWAEERISWSATTY